MDMIWVLALLVTIALLVTGLFIESSLNNSNKHIYRIVGLIETLSRSNEKIRRQIEQIKEKQDGR